MIDSASHGLTLRMAKVIESVGNQVTAGTFPKASTQACLCLGLRRTGLKGWSFSLNPLSLAEGHWTDSPTVGTTLAVSFCRKQKDKTM